MYTRGSRDDYDRWAKITGDKGLSWTEIFPYILKVNPLLPQEYPSILNPYYKTEKWSAPNDPSFPEQGHYDPSVHNDNGKIGVTAPYFPHPFNDLAFEATAELGDEFPLLKDLNNGRPIGLGESLLAH
jgi:choline dehydrogenase